ncbi:MAG: hypothetical protein NC187_03870 [Candidatus Amulumruptor caecigallinarius]|nr:hypothetical protein [Candidatus Amulumruptor caecigallinarius]MCM1396610.1 hypothetical protein [Candidatus Amulumruptor caecigallinarius]MCM1453332.1 hypothetical protein [bacterium]
MKKIAVLAAAVAVALTASAGKPKIDYSLVSVPEEGGVKFERITEDADAVSSVFPAKKSLFKFGGTKASTVDWWVNPQIAITPDGKKLAYINNKNGTTNVMVKDAKRGGSSVQRTFRTNVRDFTLSPDGSTICFTEWRSGHYGIYLVDAVQGNVVRQVSNGTDNDFAGQVTKDNNHIYFHRGEGFGAYSLWSWDRKNNLFSNYSRGMSPMLDHKNSDVLYCARFTDKLESEIWRLNLKTGVEELILGLPERSFTTPQLSPDGRWILVTGTSRSEKFKDLNTDIFVMRTDGSQLTQLTFHPGNDLSAIWAPDGKSIYFVSERGTAKKGLYNVWQMDFNL